MNGKIWNDRRHAGQELALKLLADPNSIVLALPRGGVPVGFEVAKVLKLPLDIIGVKKIGAPQKPEFALGAVSEDGVPIYHTDSLQRLGLPIKDLSAIVREKVDELKQQLAFFRKVKKASDIHGKNVILVDDGVATGATIQAAIRILRNRGAKSITVAVPVIARQAKEIIERESDALVFLYLPAVFGSVGSFYADFRQVETEEVTHLLQSAPHNKD